MINKIKTKLQLIFSVQNKTSYFERDFFIKKLSKEVGNFKTVFDVGSYHGSFVESVLAFNFNVNFHCFEPFSESFTILVKKFQSNQKIKINNVAVSDINGKVQLNVNSYKETNSLLESAKVDDSVNGLLQTTGSEIVPVINLSDYCINEKIDFVDLIKIDTQGNSYNVIKGLRPLLLEKKVGYLYVEAEFVELYKEEKLFSEIDILIRNCGYQIIDIYNLNYLNNGKLAWCDVLYGIKE